MSKYIVADLLKSKLKDVATEFKTGNYYLDNSEQAVGYENALIDFEQIIDSLQQEQPSLPDNLEEAAEKFARFYDNGTCDGIAQDCFIFGAEWQKEQMVKEAMEGYVNYYEDSGGILMAEAQVGCPYHNGDKVRIIIVKEGK